MYNVLRRLVSQVDSPQAFLVHSPADMVAYNIAVASGFIKDDTITLTGLEWMNRYRNPWLHWIREHWFGLLVALGATTTGLASMAAQTGCFWWLIQWCE